jgi:hypothetical protein
LSAADGAAEALARAKGLVVTGLVNELMLVISTISSVLAGMTAVAGEMRMRRRERACCAAPESLDVRQPANN